MLPFLLDRGHFLFVFFISEKCFREFPMLN